MNIVLHSTGCPKCNVLKKKMSEKNIVYTEHTCVEEMLAMNITKVPVLEVDGNRMDFNEAVEWLKEAN